MLAMLTWRQLCMQGSAGARKSFVVGPCALVAADVEWLISCLRRFEIAQTRDEMGTMVDAPWE